MIMKKLIRFNVILTLLTFAVIFFGHRLYAQSNLVRCDCEGQKIPHQTDCSKFYMCERGYAYICQCIGGLHYDPFFEICDYPAFAGCLTSVEVPE